MEFHLIISGRPFGFQPTRNWSPRIPREFAFRFDSLPHWRQSYVRLRRGPLEVGSILQSPSAGPRPRVTTLQLASFVGHMQQLVVTKRQHRDLPHRSILCVCVSYSHCAYCGATELVPLGN